MAKNMAKKEAVRETAQEKRGFSFFNFIKTVGTIIGVISSLIFLIFFIFIFLGFASFLFGAPAGLQAGNVAVIPVKGVITTAEAEGFIEEESAVSSEIINWIDEAEKNEQIKAILFEINSPGGAPVATDEIASRIKKLNKTSVAVIREMGASGGYWVASAADYIFANRMSITGSIGVIASYLEFAGLLERYNITYRRLVAGNYKDTGSSFKSLTPEEQALMQKMLDKMHNLFIQEVAANRNLSRQKVEELATGFVYLGEEALELGLVDAIGAKEDAIYYIEQKLNITAETVEFEPTKTLLDLFKGGLYKGFYAIGRGISSELFAKEKTYSNPNVWV